MRIVKGLTLLAASCMILSCNQKVEENPFLQDFQTQFGVPPFDKLKIECYKPAIQAGIDEQNRNIEAIVTQTGPATFENTIVALDNSSPILDRTTAVFYGLAGAETNDAIDSLAIEFAPMLAEHSDNVVLNEGLFAKVKEVYEQKENLQLTREQERLLDETYKSFVRSGAGLSEADQKRLREINMEMSTLALKFDKNLLDETNSVKIWVDNEADLAGLPEWFRNSAAEEAKAAGQEGKWLFTLQNASRLPLLQYADNRALREKVYTAYINKGNNGDAYDNKEIIRQIVSLRLEKAKLMGYDNYADFALADNMAKDSKTVMDFLHNLWQYALPKAKQEAAELQKLMDKEGKGEKLAGWDWWYYTEKLRKEKYNLDEAEIKPYFKLENVREGAFAVANKLYGITVTKLEGMPVYHPDVEAFEVKDADGSHIGVFYTDYFPRAGKSSGAWMSEFRGQVGDVRPVIYNVGNFTKPVGDTPSLLTLDEVETLFHEFGHALHGLLSKCNYKGISGTSVARDFVELPSQINEHWATEPEVLKMYARHYQTGEVMPDSLIEKIRKQKTFNQGFMTTELLAAAILDMNLHTLTDVEGLEVVKYENEAMKQLGLIPAIAPRYRTTYFGHITGGYAAGYYSYLWANVLDNDAYEAFEEHGIFDQKTAKLFRTNILEKGNSEDPMVLYRNFRGAEPKMDAMLRNRGMK